MTSSDEEEATLSIPSLILVSILIFFTYQFFFTSRSSSSSSGANNGLNFTAAQVEQVSAVFPHLNRRDIMWDLHRNGGSVQATTERVLSGRGLELRLMQFVLQQAPPSFQPRITFTTPPSTSPSTATGRAQTIRVEPDLITRYNLQAKISSKGKEKEEEPAQAGWAASKDERQRILQKRRDDMILAARRRMQEKDEAVGQSGAAT
ncbi:hypothetical protein DV735_g4597, partial [Chaetothyriales sp. CBS 134920]